MSPCHKDFIDITAIEMIEFNEVLKIYLELVNSCSNIFLEKKAENNLKKQKFNDHALKSQLDRLGLFKQNWEINQNNSSYLNENAKKKLEKEISKKKSTFYWRILSPAQSCVQDLHADFAANAGQEKKNGLNTWTFTRKSSSHHIL
jgi:hypothetical protein